MPLISRLHPTIGMLEEDMQRLLTPLLTSTVSGPFVTIPLPRHHATTPPHNTTTVCLHDPSPQVLHDDDAATPIQQACRHHVARLIRRPDRQHMPRLAASPRTPHTSHGRVLVPDEPRCIRPISSNWPTALHFVHRTHTLRSSYLITRGGMR